MTERVHFGRDPAPLGTGRTCLAAVLFCCVAGGITGHGQTPTASGRPAWPYAAPAFQPLMDAVTFHLSFDQACMLPDMAAGDRFAPQVYGDYAKTTKEPEFAPGLIGQALVLGTGGAAYPSAGNLLLGHQGALALWVKPLAWRRPNGHNVELVMTSDCCFYLQRQGPAVGKDAQVLRHEDVHLLAKASRGQRQFAGLSAGILEDSEWHLLVANWRWPSMELSVDGQPFTGTSLPAVPEPDLFGGFSVGPRGPERGLLDEVMFFGRPLTPDEMQQLWALRPK